MYGGFWKSIISVHQHLDLPLGQSDTFFQRLNSHIYSPVLTGTVSTESFLAKKGTDGSAVGRGCWSWRRTAGALGHGARSTRARRSLALASHVSFMSPKGARLEAIRDGGGSHPEERHDLAAEVLRIIRRRKTRYVRGVLEKYSRTQHLLWRGDSIHVSDQSPPLVGTRLSKGCLTLCA
jgi:hypothetical protein